MWTTLQSDLPNKWELSEMENSSLAGISIGPTTLMSGPTHSFIQEARRAPTQKTQVGLGSKVAPSPCIFLQKEWDLWIVTISAPQCNYPPAQESLHQRTWQVFSPTHACRDVGDESQVTTRPLPKQLSTSWRSSCNTPHTGRLLQDQSMLSSWSTFNKLQQPLVLPTVHLIINGET